MRIKRLAALFLAALMPLSAAAAERTVTSDPQQGLWTCTDEDLRITIRRCQDKQMKLIWYECDLVCSPASPLLAVLADPERPGKKFKHPETIARENQLIFAVSDDYFGDRVYNKKTVGTVIRAGRILYDQSYRSRKNQFPNLDVMALFPDGSLKVYEHREHTAQELREMGAQQVFAFGPVMIRDGVINPELEKKNRSLEPRVAFGMVEPWHYVCIVAEGRHKQSRGVGLPFIARRMKELGVVEALNLDGGQTAALVFMGEKINTTGKFGSRSNVRSLSGMLGAGTWATEETE